jgi:hypothetical protein
MSNLSGFHTEILDFGNIFYSLRGGEIWHWKYLTSIAVIGSLIDELARIWENPLSLDEVGTKYLRSMNIEYRSSNSVIVKFSSYSCIAMLVV